jgi:hypothetical protein
MGTFHHDRGALHGITVVVRTNASRTWVGRCDTIDERGVHLLDADVHEATGAGAGAAEAAGEWLAQAAKVGVWPRHPRVLVPAAEVAAVEPLGALRR